MIWLVVVGHLALRVEGLHHHTAICALDAQPPPARSRKALAKLAEHAAKKSKQMHGEPSSTSPSDDAVRMDVERARCVALRHPIAPPHPESLTHAEVRPACRQPERRRNVPCRSRGVVPERHRRISAGAQPDAAVAGLRRSGAPNSCVRRWACRVLQIFVVSSSRE